MLNALTAALLVAAECNTPAEMRLMLDSLLEMGQISESTHRIVNRNLPN